MNKIDFNKIATVVGSFLILFSFFLTIASVSYLFTWQLDQDKLINVSFFDFIFSGDQVQIHNWLGKFGAWMSHFMMYDLFGITSFGLCFMLFLLGVKTLYKKDLLPIGKTFTVTILYMLWGSVFFAYFSENTNFIAGSFGFHINQWLTQILGSIGTITFTMVVLYLITTLLFNPDYKALFNYLFPKKEKTENEEDSMNTNDDNMHIINPIKEEEIQEDVISETVNFSEDEEITDENNENTTAEIIDETEEPKGKDENEEFEIEIPDEEETVDAEEIGEKNLAEKLVEEHGEFDPKADLEGYLLPSVDLLKEYGSGGVSVNKEELESNKDRIIETLSNYKIDIAKIKATVGPTVTLYEIIPAPGVRISKIKNLEDDIALSLSALGIRIIAPIPGKGTIGIEVPNSSPDMVSMRSLIASEKFQNHNGQLSIVMGKTITNETYVFDLTKMPHLLVAGATGQGKSVGLNAILVSILYKKHPSQVKFVLVDPKKVELTLYNKIERHFLAKLPGEEDAIITDTSKVVNTLNSLCIEMDERYELLKEAQVRTIKEYNEKFVKRKLNPEKGHRYLPYIVVLIDEFADLIMTAGKEIEHPIARIAQLARAIGIHLIVATQRPSVNVITGMIKANFPARIAFRVLSKIDSRTILDGSGADQLIGRGDMLISTGSEMIRLQCGFVDTPEVEEICSFIGDQRAYPDALILPEYVPEGSEGKGEMDMDEMDAMFVDAARMVVINQQGSASLLQRKLKLGYNRAGRIVDQLESMNIIGPFQGSKARDVLFSDVESLDEFLGSKGLI
ncbi:MAG: DNA translocase FtsK 4TM domain-containing protein [Crocinitomicaceae bacterium]|nr:DNA translocase FtsK 4TM domain-containing protein [Crocinitomicaceae bacterium]